MNRDDIREKMNLFLEYMRQEQEIRDQLLTLKFAGENEHEVNDALERQKKLLAELRILREEKMLPMLNEVAEFTQQKKAAILTEPED